MWVPSWQSPCGLAEYTRHLTEALPSVRVTAARPVLCDVQLLHVQHEPSLFYDSTLPSCIEEANSKKVPVVVTEHTISTESEVWEGNANALVALTERGVRTLQDKWPAKLVRQIPHGCPTWFPPRKRSRGRVIGIFGFLEKYKGFGQILDVLRVLPGTELLMFSYAKSPELEAEWEAAAHGLNVRRERRYLPITEIAQRLAAEADIVVCWYDEIVRASASGAVRVALATGVPVITSPVSWFSELSQATYQPENLIDGVARLLEDTQLRDNLTVAAHDFCHANSWSLAAERHLALWRELEAA